MTELLFAFGWTLGIGVAVPVAVFAIALLHRPALHYHYHVHRSADEDAPTRTRTVPVLLPPVCQIAAKPQRALPPPVTVHTLTQTPAQVVQPVPVRR